MADKPNISKEGYVSALTQVGFWATPQNPIQYSFLEQQPAYMGNMQGWLAFSPAQRTAVQQAFAMIAEVVNLTFVQVPDNQQEPGPGNPRINFYANSNDLSFSGSMLAYRVQEGPEIHGADIRFNNARIAQRQSNEGWWDFTSFVALHEVMHAMGLSHPGNYNGQGPTYQNDAEFVEDTVQYSVMSYFGAANTGADHTLGNVQYGGRTPLLYDILALQSLYSPNMNTRAGDTVYGFNSNTGATSPFNFAVTTGPVVAIWDGGGVDTIDLSGYGEGSLIDLNAGAFSDAGGLTKNIAIAFNVTIENAVGGTGADRLFGNGVANRLDGGAGADHMEGALGDDVYLVDDPGDVVAEAGGAGRDEVRTALATYVLAANVEVLTGTSPSAQTLTGNGLANTISGGAGDDTISGGVGDDVLEGGAGNGDTAVFAGNFADYEITGATTIRDLNAANGDEGTDSLTGIELARFADTTVQLGVDSNNPPVLGDPDMVDQVWADGQAAAYTIPATSFIDLDGQDTLTFKATLTNGSPLPAWLSFDASTRTFSGTPPLAAVGVPLAIRVTADDGKVAIFDDLTISVTQAPGADINGTDGNDVLEGTFRAERMVGGDGDDVLRGSPGADILHGFSGTDQVDYSASPAGVTVDLATGLASGGHAEGDQLFAIEGVTGSSRADRITGSAGNDSIAGGAGADWLDGGAGADSLAGGLGNDIYIVDVVHDIVTEAANAGIDEVRTGLAAYALGAEVEKLTGLSATGQALTGNGLANFIAGGAGNDRIDGGLGADQMAGGLGNDIYFVDHLGDSVADTGGIDEIRTSLSDSTASANVETLTGLLETGQTLRGNGLGNLFSGGAGADRFVGGTGDDVYLVGSGDNVIEKPGEGADEVRTALAVYALTADVERLVGTAPSGQALTGNALANTILGGTGHDRIDGGAGADQMAAGLGDDVYYIDHLGDVVTEGGSAGTDEVRTTLSDTTASANVENITGLLNSGQTLRGNGLGNFIAGGAGADRFVGGLGDDIYLVGAGDNVIEKPGEGTDEVRTALAAYTLTADVERLVGTAASGQALTGNALANVILGGAGNDRIDGGGGADQMAGGLGDDLYFIGQAGDAVTEAASAGTDEVRTSLADTLAPVNVENITGLLNTGQTLRGNGLGNLIAGGTGADRMVGGLGDDVYVVGTGDNVIERAGEGTDEVRTGLALYTLGSELERLTGTSASEQALTGNALANLIVGGAGVDRLTGGGGADVFRYLAVTESNSLGRDHILDFTPGTDKIDLGAIDASRALAGDQAFAWIGSDAFSNTAGELRATQSGGEWIVEGDINGDGFADLIIALTLQGPTPLGAGDFVL
jgi:serralysin